LPIAVLAQTPTIPDVDVIEVLGRLTNWLWTILLMAGVIAVIISGYMFVTSGGDPERIRTAWKLAVYSIVGVIVAGLAWGIVAIIRAVVEG
jgi:hypothetical protein